jgi:hypothetical protein
MENAMLRLPRKATMKPRHIGLSVAWIVASLAPAAHAQFINDLHLYASCSHDSFNVLLSVEDGGLRPDLVGYDVFRRPLGPCTVPNRITETPLARFPGSYFSHELRDGDVALHTAYEYEVVGVDANRQPVSLYGVYNPGVVTIAYASCGPAPIAHGMLVDSDGRPYLEPCASSCYVEGFVEDLPAELLPYVGSGVALLLTGELMCGTVEACHLHVTAATEQDCTVAVQPRTWTHVKSTYR